MEYMGWILLCTIGEERKRTVPTKPRNPNSTAPTATAGTQKIAVKNKKASQRGAVRMSRMAKPKKARGRVTCSSPFQSSGPFSDLPNSRTQYCSKCATMGGYHYSDDADEHRRDKRADRADIGHGGIHVGLPDFLGQLFCVHDHVPALQQSRA